MKATSTNSGVVPVRAGWIERYTRFAQRRSGWILLLGSLLLALGVATASRLSVQGDFVELLPSESAAAQRFRAALARKGGGDSTLVVLVQSPAPEKNRAFVDRLQQRLQGLPKHLFKTVDAGPREIRAYFQQFRWLFSSQEELGRAECELEQARARSAPGYLGIEDPCHEPGTGAAQPATEPHGERGRLRSLQAELERRIREADRFPDGYYRTPDSKVYALVVRARRAGMGEHASDQLFHETTRIAREVAGGIGGLDVGFGGDIPTAIAERDALLEDIGVVSLVATLLVFGAIVTFFRSLRALLYIGFCVSVGTSLAFATAYLAFGRLNAASSFLGSIIVGNGINYAIVYLARYTEQRRSGLGVEAALVDAATTCGSATGLAALAASLSYLSLAATSFRGFSEFGVVGGVGMIACWLTTFVFMPACVARFDSRRELPPRPIQSAARWSLPGWLTAWAADHPRTTLLGAAVLLLAVTWPVIRYAQDPWEYDFGRLRSQSSGRSGASHYSNLADRVFGARGAPVLVLAESMSDAPLVASRALDADRRLNGGKLLEKAETIYDRLGGEPAVARAKLEVLGRIREHVDALSPRLTAEDASALAQLRPPDDLRLPQPRDLPAPLLEQFTESNGRVGTPVYLSLNRGVSQSRGENLLKISRTLDELESAPGVPLPNAGRATVFAEMIRSMERDGPRATLLSLLAVIAVVLLVTRSLVPALCILGSLLLSVVLLVGFAAVVDLRLNFLNFVALPLTFGIGVEYAINVQARARFSGGIRGAGRSVGGAVVLCSLTAVFGYGALLFADNLALRSFGSYAIVGELACLVSALLVLPAALAWLERRRAASEHGAQNGGALSVPRDCVHSEISGGSGSSSVSLSAKPG